MAQASGEDFEQSDSEKRQQPNQQRVVVTGYDPVVDRVFDDQRRRDRAGLPEQAGEDRADDAAGSARRMLDEGAAIIDVGGESTRPGSEGVSLDEELRRVVPVLEALRTLPVSIDTAKSQVAARALELGALLVNDVTALRDRKSVV